MVELFVPGLKVFSFERFPFEQISKELANESVTPHGLKYPQ